MTNRLKHRKLPIEIVDLPIKDRDVPIKTGDFPSENGDFPVRKVSTLTLCCGDGISPIVWWNSSSGVHQLL